MRDVLAALKRQALAGICLPAGDFFRPTERFFDALKPFHKQGINFIDAGTGSGRVPVEARKHGLNMLGIDLCDRVDQEMDVLCIDATQALYGPKVWPTICRPSHDGWCYDTIVYALKRGAGVFYAGLDRNVAVDLEEFADLATLRIWADVGEDGEKLYLIPPGTTPYSNSQR